MNSGACDRKELNKCLKNLLEGKYDEAVKRLSEFEEDETGQLLMCLANTLSELYAYTIDLSKGNLSATAPGRTNYVAMGVKGLHSKLNHLIWQLKQVAEGDYTQVVDYMGELSEGFNWMTKQLRLKREQAEYERNHDKLTGLLTRDAFMRKVFDMISSDPESTGIMLCCGLDNLKNINDTYGHEAGDKCIIEAADIFGTFDHCSGVASRVSGDEFAIYMHGQARREEAEDFTRSMVDMFFKRAEININGIRQKIRASYGVSFYPDDAVSVDMLLKYASYAMFEVKGQSRGELFSFDSESYLQKSNLFEKQEKLNLLIDEKLIRFAFQPIVDLSDGSIFGYEALMRPLADGFSSPLEILRLAESQSKLHQIERLTFELILDWLDSNMDDLKGAKIFFNTLSSHFLEESEILSIHPNASELCKHMVFEVLENAVEESYFPSMIASFRKRFSCLMAIDDYGCGYSNDFRLISLNPDIVKIDRFFIKDVHRNSDKHYLLSNIISFCSSKGMAVLAEGVETFEELEKVIELGFDYAQGYYFAKPCFTLQQIDTGLLKGARGHGIA